MPLPRRGGFRLAALAWLGALLAAALALERPAPLFVNLGAGDAALARGFRGGWERDGLRQTGETMFRWTLDGARLEVPVSVWTGSLTARMRVARFAPGPAEVAVAAGGGERDRWTQASQGWRVREVPLGDVRGPLTLLFRSQSSDALGLGMAVDWMEVTGARLIVPRPRVLAGLVPMLLGVPLLLALFHRSARVGLVAGALLLLASAALLLVDRLGTLLALSRAGPPSLLALLVVALVSRALARAWPELVPQGAARAAVVPAVAVVAALVAIAHPFYYYPDVDTHARYLAAARADPRLLADPADYQTRTGAWTREIGGRRVAFPYSPAFHVLAWPPAVFLGEELAVKGVAAAALGTTVLLVSVLARSLGFGPWAAVLAQALLVLLPVTASRLVLALYPALLAQALELLLIVCLARMFDPEDSRRSRWGRGLLLVLCQAAYTGSLLTVPALVTAFALLVAASGDRRRALALVGLYAAAALAVVLSQYARFLPVFWRDVAAHLRDTPAAAATEDGGGGIVAPALRRAGLFYDAVYPLLLLPGLLAARAAPVARRAAAAALLAGAALLVLRYAIPIVFRDAKEVELLAGPVAALAAGGAAWLWRRGPVPRAAAALALAVAAAWGASRAAAAYADRFVAVGR
jgi:hypothetical protein